MEIIEVDINLLKPAEYNPRAMSKKEAKDLEASLDKFGMVEPIVVNKAEDRKNIIVGGHQRYFVLKAKGVKTIPVVYVDIPDLKKEQELNLRLNKNLGHWDWAMLANFDEELLKEAGFDDLDLSIFTSVDSSGFYKGQGNKDNIEELLGYYGGSFWKDISNRKDAETWKYLMPLPKNEKKNVSRQRLRYSRTNPIEIERIVKTYMRKGDYFLESCCGWSTFGSIAKYFGYSGIGVDIWDVALNYSKKQISKMPERGKVEIIKMDAMNLTFEDKKFDFIYCNPPFFNLESYSESKEDICSNDYDGWVQNITKLTKECFRLLKDDKLAVFTMADFRKGGYLVDATSEWIGICKKCGFKLWDYVVAEVKSQSLMVRKRAYDLKRTVKCHENVVVLKKP